MESLPARPRSEALVARWSLGVDRIRHSEFPVVCPVAVWLDGDVTAPMPWRVLP
jgi:hypothetical protein